jgi:HK97 family phage portal protein
MAFDIGKLFGRKKPEIRNDVVVGLSFEDLARMFSLGNGGSRISAANAMEAIPVQACCALIAGGIVSMPLRLVQREVVDGMMVQRPADDHDYWWLFNEQPNSDSTSAQFWEQIVKRKLLWGRAFARIVRKGGGRSIAVDELVFLRNEDVLVETEWDSGRRRTRIVRYLVRDGEHTFGVLPEDMLDFRGTEAGIVYKMSDSLYAAREAVGIVLTIEQYCSKFFANGGMPRTVLKYPAGVTLDQKQQDALREAFVKKLGGADNAALPLVLANGGDAVKLSFTAEEAQMLEARKFQVIEIARSFGVPPFMIGETEKTSAWGTGIEQMSQGFIRYTLGPHITAIEQEINRKLFRISRYFVDFDEEALARGDMKSLGDWFRQAVGGSQGPGFMTVDEVRSRLKLAPTPGGGTLYTPSTGATQDASGQKADGANSDQSGQA